MKEINIIVAALSRNIVIVEKKERSTLKPNPYIDTLQKELKYFCHCIIPAEDLEYVKKEDVDNLYNQVFLKTTDILVNPDYPDLIKVDIPDTFRKLNDKIGGEEELKIMTQEEYIDWLNNSNAEKLRHFEYVILYNNRKSMLSKFLYQIYIKYQNQNKLYIPRKDRKIILEKINKLDYEKQTKIDLILWKKLRKILHPGEYATSFPSAYNFFQEIRKTKLTESHENQPEKLQNILCKAWKNGKEDIALDNYLSQKTRVLDILETLRYYYIRPGISKYKKLKNKTIGNKEPEEIEKEIIDIVKMELKKKLLNSLHNTKISKYIPREWKSIAAWELIYPHYEIEVPRMFFIISKARVISKSIKQENCTLTTQRLLQRQKIMVNPDICNNTTLFFLCNNLNEGIHQELVIENQDHNIVWSKNIDTNKNSILAFVYYPNKNKIEWIGENTKQIYSGQPGDIIDKREWDILIQKPNPKDDHNFLSLYTLAEKLFINDGIEKLTMEEVLCELKN